MRKSTFTSDLKKERNLAPFLDRLYSENLKSYDFVRNHDQKEQLMGIDVVFTHKKTNRSFNVDEKAQLDYLNERLPTFAFEVSYLKDGERKKGWLFDNQKKTEFYALVTSIFSDAPEKYTSCKITLVNRSLLLSFLEKRKVVFEKLSPPNNHGKQRLEALDERTEGYLYFSKRNKAEQPLNIVLRLDFLLENGIAKVLV